MKRIILCIIAMLMCMASAGGVAEGKDYDIVLLYPVIAETYIDTTDEYAEYEVGAFGNVQRTVYERTVTISGGVAESAGEHKLRPVRAGEGSIEVIVKENGKVKETTTATVYVAESAVTGGVIDDVTDLAANRPIWASSEVPACWRYYANDGDMESYWESQGYPAEIVVDLEGKATVSSVSVKLNPEWGKRTQKIEVYVSTDGENYEKVSDEKEHLFDPHKRNMACIMFMPTEARHVKIRFTGGEFDNAQATEISVNGKYLENVPAAGEGGEPDGPSEPMEPDEPDFGLDW